MGLPVSKVEPPVSPEAPAPSQSISFPSSPETLSRILINVAPAFAAILLAVGVDLLAPSAAGFSIRAGAAYFALAVSVAILIRGSLRAPGLLSYPVKEPFLSVVAVAVLAAATCGTVLTVQFDPLSDFAAHYVLELAAVVGAISLWIELRNFIVRRLEVLADPAASLFPSFAWTRAAADAPEVKTAPETLRPGDLCL